MVSFPEPQRRVRALQGSNDTLIVNGTLTITLPQRLSATLTNDTTIVMISKSALAGADNAATCAEQSVTRLPAMLTASGCGADTYVLLVTRKDTVIDPMIIPPSTSGPALKSGVSALVVGLAVCGIVVVVVGVVVAAARRHRSRERIAPLKALQSVVITAPCVSSPPSHADVDAANDPESPTAPVATVVAWQQQDDSASDLEQTQEPKQQSLPQSSSPSPSSSPSQVTAVSQQQPLPKSQELRQPFASAQRLDSSHGVQRIPQMPQNPSARRHAAKHSTNAVQLPSTIADGATTDPLHDIVSFDRRPVRLESHSSTGLPPIRTSAKDGNDGVRAAARTGTVSAGSIGSAASRRALWGSSLDAMVAGATSTSRADRRHDRNGSDSESDVDDDNAVTNLATAHSRMSWTEGRGTSAASGDALGRIQRPLTQEGTGAGLGDDLTDDVEEMSLDNTASTVSSVRRSALAQSVNKWVVDTEAERRAAMAAQAAAAGMPWTPVVDATTVDTQQPAHQPAQPSVVAAPRSVSPEVVNDDSIAALFGMANAEVTVAQEKEVTVARSASPDAVGDDSIAALFFGASDVAGEAAVQSDTTADLRSASPAAVGDDSVAALFIGTGGVTDEAVSQENTACRQRSVSPNAVGDDSVTALFFGASAAAAEIVNDSAAAPAPRRSPTPVVDELGDLQRMFEDAGLALDDMDKDANGKA